MLPLEFIKVMYYVLMYYSRHIMIKLTSTTESPQSYSIHAYHPPAGQSYQNFILSSPPLFTDIVGVGSVLRCMVTKIKGDQEKGHWNVVLSADPEALSDATLPITSTTNMSLMIPGTAVDTAISKVFS